MLSGFAGFRVESGGRADPVLLGAIFPDVKITDFTVTPPDKVQITFLSFPGNKYQILHSTTLENFSEIATLVATGTSTTFTRSGFTLPREEFFRVHDLGKP